MAISGFTHDSVNNRTIEWYTPKWIFDEMGVEFDLDPCTIEGGVPWIPSKKNFSVKDNGLLQEWEGRVFLNPPYGKYTSV